MWAAVCVLVLGMASAFLYAPLWQPGYDAPPSGAFFEHTGDRVNINEATAEELQVLPGIGQTRARSIVEYRQAHGPFASVEALTDVPGIGEKTLEDIRAYVCV